MPNKSHRFTPSFPQKAYKFSAKEGRDKANDAARQGKEFLNRHRDTLNTAIDRGREAYNQARSGPQPGPAGDQV
jgi:hypothetical protein